MRWPPARLSAAQVNLLLEALVIVSLASGLASWTIGTGWVRWLTIIHGVSGLALLVLAPAKFRRSVRTGMRRGRATRWLSVGFGVLVLAAVGTGLLHATGLWYGVGEWSALWVHLFAAFVLIPLFVWHVFSRPAKLRKADADRRLLLGGVATAATAVAVYGAQEVLVRGVGLAGGDRRFTGSHEVGSFDPDALPVVSWFDDSAPSTPADEWELRIAGSIVDLAALRSAAVPLDAVLDCTGGWWSEQRWDVVSLAELHDWSGRSIEVGSATGFRRWFPTGDADRVYVAVGYSGRSLRRGHGAPVRIVAPGRRGPWWVKWVTDVSDSARPPWLQSPFPLT